jgi:hypothetical protein
MFQLAQLTTVRSNYVRPVYVSYRKDNRIFWTSHPIHLHEGETLLTDGTLDARARCGNRISLVPQLPVAQAEPPPGVLDTPEETEVIPEPLLHATVEIGNTPVPVIGPEDFASPVTRTPVLDDVPATLIPIDNIFRVVPVVSISPISTPVLPGGVPTDFKDPYPLPPAYVPLPGFVPPPTITFSSPPGASQPVPEPGEPVLLAVPVIAFILVSLRRLRGRPVS